MTSLPSTLKHAAKSQFNRFAAHYDDNAFIQRTIAERLIEKLQYTKLSPNTICDLGCSTGYTSQLAATHYPHAKLVGVDIAQNLLKQTRAPTTPCCADAEQLPFVDNTFDLVVSNLMLQWCDAETVFKEVHRILKPEGLFLFTTLGPDTLLELRESWRGVDEHPHTIDFIDLHDIGDTLTQQRYTSIIMEMDKLVFHYKTLNILLQDIRAIGAGNAHQSRHKSLMGKGKWQRFSENYQQQFSEGDKLPATYEVVYGHAWKPTPSGLAIADEEGVATFPLENLRRK